MSISIEALALSGVIAATGFLFAGSARADIARDQPAPPSLKRAEDAVMFHQRGLASWYGPHHAGRKTASGTRFNPRELTAAHKTLPLGSLISVTNLANGRQLIVRVTDRGPHIGSRVLDLSQAAAERLGFLALGVVPVEIAVLPSR